MYIYMLGRYSSFRSSCIYTHTYIHTCNIHKYTHTHMNIHIYTYTHVHVHAQRVRRSPLSSKGRCRTSFPHHATLSQCPPATLSHTNPSPHQQIPQSTWPTSRTVLPSHIQGRGKRGGGSRQWKILLTHRSGIILRAHTTRENWIWGRERGGARLQLNSKVLCVELRLKMGTDGGRS